MSPRIVLLAEDEVVVRHVAAIALEREDFVVLAACDGDEALVLARANSRVDLLVTDVQMSSSGIDGFALAEHIIRERPGTRVLVMSGRPNWESVAAEKGLAFLAKPFTPADLVQRVWEVLGVRPAQSEANTAKRTRHAG